MSTTPLDKLGDSVQAATAEIKKLRRENERLKEKAAKLEASLEAVPAADSESVAWAEERATIHGRLEELAAHLEGVLEA